MNLNILLINIFDTQFTRYCVNRIYIMYINQNQTVRIINIRRYPSAHQHWQISSVTIQKVFVLFVFIYYLFCVKIQKKLVCRCHHIIKFFVIYLSITVNVCFFNHGLYFISCQRLAKIHHYNG